MINLTIGLGDGAVGVGSNVNSISFHSLDKVMEVGAHIGREPLPKDGVVVVVRFDNVASLDVVLNRLACTRRVMTGETTWEQECERHDKAKEGMSGDK